eukprot:5691629-Amphidinium_carterae.1
MDKNAKNSKNAKNGVDASKRVTPDNIPSTLLGPRPQNGSIRPEPLTMTNSINGTLFGKYYSELFECAGFLVPKCTASQ